MTWRGPLRRIEAETLRKTPLPVAESEKMFSEQGYQDVGTARQQARRGTFRSRISELHARQADDPEAAFGRLPRAAGKRRGGSSTIGSCRSVGRPSR
jgi:hypothetical protein